MSRGCRAGDLGRQRAGARDVQPARDRRLDARRSHGDRVDHGCMHVRAGSEPRSQRGSERISRADRVADGDGLARWCGRSPPSVSRWSAARPCGDGDHIDPLVGQQRGGGSPRMPGGERHEGLPASPAPVPPGRRSPPFLRASPRHPALAALRRAAAPGERGGAIDREVRPGDHQISSALRTV